jgi:hypothetical protein
MTKAMVGQVLGIENTDNCIKIVGSISDDHNIDSHFDTKIAPDKVDTKIAPDKVDHKLRYKC